MIGYGTGDKRCQEKRMQTEVRNRYLTVLANHRLRNAALPFRVQNFNILHLKKKKQGDQQEHSLDEALLEFYGPHLNKKQVTHV